MCYKIKNENYLYTFLSWQPRQMLKTESQMQNKIEKVIFSYPYCLRIVNTHERSFCFVSFSFYYYYISLFFLNTFHFFTTYILLNVLLAFWLSLLLFFWCFCVCLCYKQQKDEKLQFRFFFLYWLRFRQDRNKGLRW